MNKADLVIFLGRGNYEHCKKKFNFQGKYEIWDLPDFDDSDLNGQPLNMKKETEYIKISEAVFSQIKRNADQLLSKL